MLRKHRSPTKIGGFAAAFIVSLLILSCSALKLSDNCLNQKSGCFKADVTTPKFQTAVSPAENELVSVLSTVDLMFSEELNNPQPSDFIFSGAASMTVNAVQKLNDYTYRLILTQNSLTSGTITLSFPNLKDYNGNKISGPTSVTYIGNVDLPVTIPLVNPSGVAIQNPSHEGISNLNNTPAGAGGYDTIDIYWYYTYVPTDGSTTTYTIKRSTGATDCNSATTIGSFTVAPTPAVGAVNSYDATNVTTKTNTTYKFTLKPVAAELPAPTPPQIYQTILICVDNVINNKHGKAVLNLIRDDSRPTTSLSPLAPAGPVTSTPPIPTAASNAAKTLNFNCSDNVDRILYSASSTIGTGVVPLLSAVTDPAFNPTTGAVIFGTLYDSNNKPATPYGGTTGANPTITTYKYLCIDKAGNIENGVKSAVYEIDSSLPSVTLAHVYKTGTTKEITGVSASGYTSADFIWHTNQTNKYWEIRRGATSCGTGGTVVASATTTGLTTPSPADTLVTTQITPTSPGIAAGENQLLLCVGNNTAFGSVTKWGQESFTLLRANGPIALPQVNIAAGNYGAQQNLVFTCDPTTVDKIAYMEAIVAGAGTPTAPVANPDFTPNGDLDTTIIGNTLFAAPIKTTEASTTVYKVTCIDRAGNKSSTLTTGNYRIDSILPTITVVSNTHDALSNTSGFTTTTLIWRSSRGGLAYHVKQPGTACGGADLTTGTNLTGAATPTDVSQTISTTIDIANFGAETTYDIQICVQNFIGQWGYTSYTLRKDITAPNILPANLTPSISLVSGDTFTLSWNAAADAGSGVAVYRIFRDTATTPTFPGYPNSPEYIAAATSGLNSTNITMPNGSKYNLRIVPVDAAGNVTALASSYNYIATRLNLLVSVTGYTTDSDFRVQSGSDTLAFNIAPGGTQAFATGFTPGATYNISITSQPSRQNCAFTSNQYGTINSDTTLAVQCVPGYFTGNGMTASPPVPLNYHLYRGNSVIVAGGSTGTNCGASCNNGTGSVNIRFDQPHGITHLKGVIYTTEYNTHQIRQYTISTATMATIAGAATVGSTDDSTGTNARFNRPNAVTTDGVSLYVSELGGQRIRRVSLTAPYAVTTLAGGGTTGTPCPGVAQATCLDGPGLTARFAQINHVQYNNGYVYIADYTHNRIRRLNLSTGIVETIAGTGAAGSADGDGVIATFNAPSGLTSAGGYLYVADINANKIRRVSLTSPFTVTTVAGTGSAGKVDGHTSVAVLSAPDHLTTDGSNLFVSDFGNNIIRRINLRTNIVSTISGYGSLDVNGVGPAAGMASPVGIVTDGRRLFTVSHNGNNLHRIADQGLIGYWTINPGVNPDDYNSENAAPASSSVVGGSLSTTADRYGTGIASSLNGTSQYVSAGGSGVPSDLDQAVTLAAWVKPTDLSQESAIMGTTSFKFRFNIGTNGSVYFQNWYNNGAGTKLLAITSAGLIKPGVWTHIAYVHKPNMTVNQGGRIYINGHDMTLESTAVGTASDAVNVPLTIGYSTASSIQTYMKGGLADVRVYSRALSEGELNELAQDAVSTQVDSSFNTRATGLLSHYVFDTGAENNPAGPLGGNLSITGTKVSVIGKDGDADGAIYYDGTTNYFTSSPTGLPVNNAPRTICAWVRPSAYPVATLQSIVSYGDVGTLGACTNLTTEDNGGTPALKFGSCGSSTAEYTGANYKLPLNTWSHVCGTLGAGNTVNIYVNGNSIVSTTGVTTNWVTATAGQPLRVGSFPNTGYRFPGAIDDVRIYDNTLSATQIRQLATQVPAGLVLRLDTNGDATDISGFAQSLLSNAGSLTSGRYGIANTAYRFTSGQSAQFAHSSSLGNMQDLTVSFWMRSPDLDSTLGSEIVTKYSSCGSDGWTVKYDNSTFFQAQCGGGVAISNRVRAKNVWTHYTYVRTGTSARKLYVNGADVTSGTPGTPTALVPNTVPLGIAIGSGDKTLQDIRVYNRSLTTSEVRALSGYHLLQGSPGLRLHLQADTFSNLNDNDTITGNWTDSAPNPYNINYPTIGASEGVLSGATGTISYVKASSGMNGNSGIAFPGTIGASTKVFDFGTGNAITYSGGMTVCSAFIRQGTGFTGIIERRTGSDANSWALINDSGAAIKFELNVGPSVSTAMSSSPAIYCVVVNSGGGFTPYFNGTSGTSASGTLPASTPALPLTVGNRYGWGAQFNGVISEVSFATQAATTTDLTVSQCYLSAKYSIPLTGTPAPPVCP